DAPGGRFLVNRNEIRNQDGPPQTQPHDSTLAQAEAHLTQEERDKIQRRFENLTSQDNEVPGPSRDKGKGPDPRNWGQLQLEQYEQDVDIQQAMLDEINRQRLEEQEELLQLPDNRRRTGYRIPSATPSLRTNTRENSQPIDLVSRNSILGKIKERENRDHDYRQGNSSLEPYPDHGHRRRPPNNRNQSPHQDYFPDRQPRGNQRDPGGDPGDDDDDDGDGYYPKRRPNPARGRKPPSEPWYDDYYDNDYYPRKPIIAPQSPKSYNGEINLEKYMRFRTETRGYCRRGRVHPRDQIEVISPFLEGKAYNFYLSHASASPESWTLSDFMDALFNHCFPPTFKSTLRNELKWENQGKRKVLEFVRDITVKLDTVGIEDEATRVNYLWFGFEQRIQSALWRRDLNPEFSSWNEVIKGAIASENADTAARGPQPNHSQTHQGSNNQTNQSMFHNRANHNGHSGSRNGARGERNSSDPRTNGEQSRSQGNPLPNRNSNTNNGNYNRSQTSDNRSNQNPNRQNGNSGSNGSTNPITGRPFISNGTSNQPNSRASNSNQQRPKQSKLSESEVQEHMDQGKCFRCHSHGHLARNCPNANVVQTSRPGRPPGMELHNLEMGYTTNLEDSPVLETMPGLSLGMIILDNISIDEDEELGWLDESSEEGQDEPLHTQYVPLIEFGDDDISVSDSYEYIYEPDWMKRYKDHEPDRSHARNKIGDALIMQATYVLNVSQPYPGDSRDICEKKGARNRFIVRPVNTLYYGIYDTLNGSSTWVEKRRLEHPNFRLGRFYARYRTWQLNRPDILKAPYSVRMGDAYSIVASFLLRDGIWSHYPNTMPDTDPEDRFHVELWSQGHDSYVIMDYDRSLSTIIPAEHLKNSNFDLVRWYQLVVQEKRGLDAESYPLHLFERGSGYPLKPMSDNGSEITCEYADDEPSVLDEHDSNEELDSLPGLQSVSYTGSDVSDDNAHGFDPLDELRAEYQHYQGHDVVMDNALGKAIAEALDNYVPYPADDLFITPDIERFEVFCLPEDDPDLFHILDHRRGEVAHIRTEQLRDPDFDIGRLYATSCCARSGLNDFEGAMREWRRIHPEGNTGMERYFERSIEYELTVASMGFDLWPFDGYEYPRERFSVERAPEYLSPWTLLVTDNFLNRERFIRNREIEFGEFNLTLER
ncbi:hypothetical protein CVT24_009215, partial [Panaeolus cyanescens]